MANDTSVDGRIDVEISAGIMSVTMSTPGKKNALSQAMYHAMADALDQAAADDAVRVVVLGGAEGVFTSGNNVNDFSNRPKSGKTGSIRYLETIAAFPKPLVAKVEALAIGIGTTMLLHCDLVFAAEGTRFKMPFVDLGLVPEGASSLLLPRIMGSARAAELILLGKMFDASQALEYGLINQVCSADSIDETVAETAASLAAKPPQAMRKSKALLKSGLRGAVLDRIAAESEVFGASIGGDEFNEAVSAFREKRAPDFSKLG